jgi:hypothetical protein
MEQQKITQHVLQNLRHVPTTTPHQKLRLSNLSQEFKKNFERIASIMTKKSETNLDVVLLILSLAVKEFILNAVNFYHGFVKNDAKKLQKFVSTLSQTSLRELQKPFSTILKNKTRIASMTEQQSEDYAERMRRSLEEYLMKKQRTLDAVAHGKK